MIVNGYDAAESLGLGEPGGEGQPEVMGGTGDGNDRQVIAVGLFVTPAGN